MYVYTVYDQSIKTSLCPACSVCDMQLPHGDSQGSSWNTEEVIQTHSLEPHTSGKEANQGRHMVCDTETDGVYPYHLQPHREYVQGRPLCEFLCV